MWLYCVHIAALKKKESHTFIKHNDVLYTWKQRAKGYEPEVMGRPALLVLIEMYIGFNTPQELKDLGTQAL